jgi:hypothetical protein
MTGNIVGESFEQYVKDQIKVRQEIYGSGFNQNRTPEQINYLNSKLSWIKMASSVEFIDEYPSPFISGSSDTFSNKENTAYHGEATKKLSSVFGESSDVERFKGKQLAKKAILFNGLTNLDLPLSSPRSGITPNNKIWDDENYVAYGLGGLDFGIQPMPGITSFNIKHLNRGSIREAEVTLKAFNKKQFEILELLYLRLGYSMLIEWGNNTYFKDKDTKEDISTTLVDNFWFNDNQNIEHIDVLREIENKRKLYVGNYDAFFGRVTNFRWNFNPDGSYDITLNIHGLGSVMESLKVNIADSNSTLTPKEQETQRISRFRNDKISNFLNSIMIQPQITKIEKKISQTKATTRLQELKANLDDLRKQILPQTEEIIDNFSEEVINLDQTWTQTEVGIKVQRKFENTSYNYYIRFGAFLSFLRDYVLLRLTNDQGNSSFPILNINNDPSVNIMYGEDKQFSVDPRVCIVNNPSVFNYFPKGDQASKDNFKSVFDQFDPWFVKDKIKYALPMNIYLNFEFILSVLEGKVDDKGNLSLYTFLETICSRINKSLGGVNNLQPIIDESTNSITIIDQTPVPGKNSILNNDKETPILELYGYSESASNFVKNFNFQTEITPDLATTITIGATSNGTVVGEDATAFSKWNLGLVDRYNKEIFAPESVPSTKIEPLNEIQIKALSDEELRKQVEQLGGLKSYLFLSPTERKKRDALRKEVSRREVKVIKENEKFNLENNYTTYIKEAFGAEPFDFTYFKEEENFVQRGFQILKNNLILNQSIKSDRIQNPSPFSGFLPLNLSLELEGLSGIILKI